MSTSSRTIIAAAAAVAAAAAATFAGQSLSMASSGTHQFGFREPAAVSVVAALLLTTAD